MCAVCERPASACICALAAPVAGQVELLILQHPMEAGHDKGTGRLLQLSVAGSRLLRGEQFAPETLHAALNAGGRTPVLLFPETGKPADAPAAVEPSGLRLVVLDGTWRKCRKMLYLNPMLAELPRLALKAPPPSQYRIRSAHAADQLSTLEAACLALAELERAPGRYQSVMAAFQRFVQSHPALAYRAQ